MCACVPRVCGTFQSLRKLCVPQQRPGSYRPGRAPKTMAVKHMAFFQGAGGSVVGGGMGSVTDMWGDGVVSVTLFCCVCCVVEAVPWRLRLVERRGTSDRSLIVLDGLKQEILCRCNTER